jgi:hypothetical protein
MDTTGPGGPRLSTPSRLRRHRSCTRAGAPATSLAELLTFVMLPPAGCLFCCLHPGFTVSASRLHATAVCWSSRDQLPGSAGSF